MRKRLALALLVLGAVCALAACGGRKPAGPPPDLTGEWIQPSGGDWYHVATITDDKLEIWWFLPAYGIRNLYWSGTFTPPADDKEPYAWESSNNYTVAQLEASYANRRASREPVKTFTYEDGKITYIVTAGHLQMTYSLIRVEDYAAQTGK